MFWTCGRPPAVLVISITTKISHGESVFKSSGLYTALFTSCTQTKHGTNAERSLILNTIVQHQARITDFVSTEKQHRRFKNSRAYIKLSVKPTNGCHKKIVCSRKFLQRCDIPFFMSYQLINAVE